MNIYRQILNKKIEIYIDLASSFINQLSSHQLFIEKIKKFLSNEKQKNHLNPSRISILNIFQF